MAAMSLSTRTTFFGALGLTRFELADGGGTEFSLSGLAATGALRSGQASSADESEQAVACGSIAGSLLEKPSGTANNTSGAPCGVEFCQLNCGPRRVIRALAPLFFGWSGTIAATLSI
jgi:hypothetical protein